MKKIFVDLDKDGTIVDLLVNAGFTITRSEARRLVTMGGILINDEKVTDVNTKMPRHRWSWGFTLRVGKLNSVMVFTN